jgi:hypothetical protein
VDGSALVAHTLLFGCAQVARESEWSNVLSRVRPARGRLSTSRRAEGAEHSSFAGLSDRALIHLSPEIHNAKIARADATRRANALVNIEKPRTRALVRHDVAC